MASIQIVPPQYVYHVWEQVAPFIARGLEQSGGEYTADQLKVWLTRGTQSLVLIMNDDAIIKGAITIEWINMPNDRIAFVSSVGGATYKDAWDQFLDWLRQNGCTVVRGFAVDSVVRLWKMKFGCHSKYAVVEKRL